MVNGCHPVEEDKTCGFLLQGKFYPYVHVLWGVIQEETFVAKEERLVKRDRKVAYTIEACPLI